MFIDRSSPTTTRAAPGWPGPRGRCAPRSWERGGRRRRYAASRPRRRERSVSAWPRTGCAGSMAVPLRLTASWAASRMSTVRRSLLRLIERQAFHDRRGPTHVGQVGAGPVVGEQEVDLRDLRSLVGAGRVRDPLVGRHRPASGHPSPSGHGPGRTLQTSGRDRRCSRCRTRPRPSRGRRPAPRRGPGPAWAPARRAGTGRPGRSSRAASSGAPAARAATPRYQPMRQSGLDPARRIGASTSSSTRFASSSRPRSISARTRRSSTSTPRSASCTERLDDRLRLHRPERHDDRGLGIVGTDERHRQAAPARGRRGPSALAREAACWSRRSASRATSTHDLTKNSTKLLGHLRGVLEPVIGRECGRSLEKGVKGVVCCVQRNRFARRRQSSSC